MFNFEPLHVLLGGVAMLAILNLEGPRKLANIVVLIIVVIAAVQVFSPGAGAGGSGRSSAASFQR
jgi:hypothetical protein